MGHSDDHVDANFAISQSTLVVTQHQWCLAMTTTHLLLQKPLDVVNLLQVSEYPLPIQQPDLQHFVTLIPPQQRLVILVNPRVSVVIPRVLRVLPETRARRIRAPKNEPLPIEHRVPCDKHRVSVLFRDRLRDAYVYRRRRVVSRARIYVDSVLRDVPEAA